ncbi:MAG TPA: hypothetical protein DCM48_06820 [Thalassospira sp.]|nr:hypothetical protein [Thalassospira sp.]
MPEGKGNNRLTLQRHHIVRSLVVILAYFATGYAGLQLPFFGTSVTLVWPPSGIAIAAMVFWGWRYFPAVFIGALLVNLATSPSVPAALMIAAGNTLAAVLPALLITRLAGNYPLAQFRSMLVFLALGAVCSPAIAALLGSTTLSMVVIGNFDQFGEIWQGWFLGDLVGAIVVGPLTLRLMNRQPVSRSLQH